jgi:hypothetical protein
LNWRSIIAIAELAAMQSDQVHSCSCIHSNYINELIGAPNPREQSSFDIHSHKFMRAKVPENGFPVFSQRLTKFKQHSIYGQYSPILMNNLYCVLLIDIEREPMKSFNSLGGVF